MTETIYRKVLVLQNGLSHEHFPVSFPNTSQKLLLKIEQKRLSLNDNIARCKNPRAVKDLSNSGSFFLFSFPNLFYSLYAQISCIFLKNIPHKKSIKLENLLCKDKSSQKFHKCYSGRNLAFL